MQLNNHLFVSLIELTPHIWANFAGSDDVIQVDNLIVCVGRCSSNRSFLKSIGQEQKVMWLVQEMISSIQSWQSNGHCISKSWQMNNQKGWNSSDRLERNCFIFIHIGRHGEIWAKSNTSLPEVKTLVTWQWKI